MVIENKKISNIKISLSCLLMTLLFIMTFNLIGSSVLEYKSKNI